MSPPDRIYLDNAATSWPKPEAVYAAVDRCLRTLGAPAGRGAYRAAQEADQIVDAARSACAELLGVRQTERVVFTSGGTESLNLAIHGVLQPGDHAVSTHCEHNSVLRPLEQARVDVGIDTTLVGLDGVGRIKLDELANAIRPNTRLVAVTHGSNVTGAIQPMAEIVAAVRASASPDALVLVDAAQTAGHLPIDFDTLGVDLLATGGHKALLGPLGTGLLCVADGVAERITPLKQGGTGTDSSSPQQPDRLPERFESGNLNVPALAGLLAAAEHLLREGVANAAENSSRQTVRLVEGLRQLPGVRVFGPDADEPRLPVVSFSVDDYDPQEVAAMLDATAGVECRAGLHCAPLVHRSLGTESTGGLVRFSPGWSTTDDQTEQAIRAVAALAESVPHAL